MWQLLCSEQIFCCSHYEAAHDYSCFSHITHTQQKYTVDLSVSADANCVSLGTVRRVVSRCPFLIVFLSVFKVYGMFLGCVFSQGFK